MYQCQIDIQFPSSTQALHAKQVLEVDGEIGDQVTKTFQVVSANTEICSEVTNNNSNEGGDKSSDLNVLSV